MNFFDLLQRKLLLVTGKGGIGKSVASVCLAQAAKELGKSVLIVESSSEGQIAPLFAKKCGGHHVQELTEQISCINIDMQLNFRDFVVTHLGFEQLFQKVFNQKLVQSFLRMIPGLSELTLLGRLYYESQIRKKFDLVIFDGFASGHFLQLMTTPQAVFDSGLIGPILQETKNIQSMLKDTSQCGVLMVTEPEPLIVSECLDFMGQMADRSPARVAAVLVNRFFEQPISQASLAELDKTHPQLHDLAVQVYQHHQYSQENYLILREGLLAVAQQYQQSFLLKPLADLGAIEEPIDNEQVNLLFSQSEQVITPEWPK